MLPLRTEAAARCCQLREAFQTVRLYAVLYNKILSSSRLAISKRAQERRQEIRAVLRVSQGDAKYTSAKTWREDARLCSRHFLHRSRLKFFVDTAAAAAAAAASFEEPLPEELVACLEGLEGFGLPGKSESF